MRGRCVPDLQQNESGLWALRAVGSKWLRDQDDGINVSKTVLASSVGGAMFLGLASAVNMGLCGERCAPTTRLASISVIFTPLAAFLLAKAFDRIFIISGGSDYLRLPG